MNVSGKTILITGSTDGLGKLVARHLAVQDAFVILHGRNREKGKAVMDEIYQHHTDAYLKYCNADFSSLQDVSEFSQKLLVRHEHIDILINNAGIGSGISKGNNRELSREGIELRFAVNYLSHVLLTENILPIMKPGSVIINVSSAGQSKIDFSDLMLDNNYDGYQAYQRSKTALIMYTFDLAQRLKDMNIKVNAVHPASLMNTKMVTEDWGYTLSTVEKGAEAVENLLEPSRTGTYYDGKKPSKAISQTYDKAARHELWQITQEFLEGFLTRELKNLTSRKFN